MNPKCEYGCGKEATHQFNKGKWCCSKYHAGCPGWISKYNAGKNNPDNKHVYVNGIGRSDYTETKQKHFKEIVVVLLSIYRSLIVKYPNWKKMDDSFWYFDTHAGDGSPGSSASNFLSIAKGFKFKINAVLIEKIKGNFKKLESNIIKYESSAIKIETCHGKNEDIMPEYCEAPSTNFKFGVLYSDPNGVPNLDMLKQVAQTQCFEKLDIVINLSATAIKRTLGSSNSAHSKHTKNLVQYIKEINKKHWLIKEPFVDGCQKTTNMQWTFLIGTNWTDFPKFKKLGFHAIDSDRGQEILHYLNFTRKEKGMA